MLPSVTCSGTVGCSRCAGAWRQASRSLHHLRSGVALRRIQARDRTTILRPPPLSEPTATLARRFLTSTSVRESQKDDVGGGSSGGGREEQDVLIGLLAAMMQKRNLLSKQRDANSRPEVAKGIGELDALHTLWCEWEELQKVCCVDRPEFQSCSLTVQSQTAANLLRMTDPSTEPDLDLRQMALDEAQDVLGQMDSLRHRIRSALLPNDPIDQQSAIMEIRPGVGGNESAVFSAEVARMYTRFCSDSSFQVEQLSATNAEVSATNKGAAPEAYKEVILSIKGPGAYGLLRYEAGVHRVQRVPVTVSVNKIQTSTIAIVVLPLAEQGKAGGQALRDEVVDVKDVKEEVMRSRGAGGQHVNKTESAIRLTHEPTGITVSMQDSRSQHQNRTKAWEILRARLMDRKMREDQAEARDLRRSQIASMDRFDRVRTYNFMQDRVTDHRVPISTSDITNIMEGDAREGGLLYIVRSVREHRENLQLADLRAQIDQDIVALAS